MSLLVLVLNRIVKPEICYRKNATEKMLQKKCPVTMFCAGHFWVALGAEDETRTRDPHLGKVML